MAVAFWAKSSVISDIPQQNQGILGGPVALAAPQIGSEQSSLDPVLGTEDPAGSVHRESSGTTAMDLSTGTLDGTQVSQGISASKSEKGPSLKENASKNEGNDPKTSDNAAEVAKESVEEPAVETDSSSQKVSSGHYFIQPASGHNWGVLHAHNAVDIANSCGTPVKAAAAGVIVEDPNLGSGANGWNGGYGRFIMIKHPNGTKTRYAHLSKIEVEIGEEVAQGQEIGKIGNTGSVQGQTGCHVHFEVIGAANPFAHS